MSDERNDGGDAFPQYDYGNRGRGMSLRDWFAGQVLAGRMARNSTYPTWQDAAQDAYECADAMLAARSKVKP